MAKKKGRRKGHRNLAPMPGSIAEKVKRLLDRGEFTTPGRVAIRLGVARGAIYSALRTWSKKTFDRRRGLMKYEPID